VRGPRIGFGLLSLKDLPSAEVTWLYAPIYLHTIYGGTMGGAYYMSCKSRWVPQTATKSDKLVCIFGDVGLCG
jgi:hypothetical protein